MTPVIVRNAVIEIVWGGDALCSVFEGGSELLPNQDLSLPALKGVVLNKLYDPQGVFTTSSIDKSVLKGKVSGQSGYHTFFVHVQQGQMQWWQPVDVNIKQEDVSVMPSFTRVKTAVCEPVNMEMVFNASVTDIYRNEYLSPRSPYTTLQLPKQGIGEWCHPTLTADIDDSGMRAQVRSGLLSTSLGVPFRTPAEGKNIAFTSLWDNYPDSLTIPLTGKASMPICCWQEVPIICSATLPMGLFVYIMQMVLQKHWSL